MPIEQGVFISTGPLETQEVIDYLLLAAHLPEVCDKQDAVTEHFWAAILHDLMATSLLPMFRQDSEQLQFALYIAKDSEQAFCSREDGFYLITIGYDVLCRLALIASRLLPVITFKTERYDSKNEKVNYDQILIDYLLNVNMPSSQAVSNIALNWFSNLDYPNQASHLVFYDQMRLIFFHELSHCIFSHVDVCEEKLGFSILYESNCESNKNLVEENYRLLQAMECEADWHAVLSLTNQIFCGYDTAETSLGISNMDLSQRMAILNLSLAIFAIYWRVKEADQGIEPVSNIEELKSFPFGYYPPANIRYMIMSEYMFNLVARLGVEHGLNELYPFPDDYNDNISLYTLRNANIGHPYFSLLIKQHSMKLFYNLINLAPGLEYVIGLSGPFRFSRRQDRPMNSYNSHTYHDFWTNRSRSMSNAYVTITCDNELIELIEYPSLIIHGQMDPKVAIQESFGFSELKLIFGDNWEIYKKLYFSKFLAP